MEKELPRQERLHDSQDHEEGLSGAESQADRREEMLARGTREPQWIVGWQMCHHPKESPFIYKLFNKDFRESL